MTVGIDTVELRPSPHLKDKVTTDVIMANVAWALVPICLFAVWSFGLSALLLLLVCTAACVATEDLIYRLSGNESPIRDNTAVITGMLLALTLPPGFPLWMGAVGGVVSIAMGKALFGGLGFNSFNPALVGRAFLQASFPVAITTWTPPYLEGRFTQLIPSTMAPPFMTPAGVVDFVRAAGVDGFTGATPLALMEFEHQATPLTQLFIGTTAGSMGETSALLIILCGFYLIARRMMNWRIPASILLTMLLLGAIYYAVDPVEHPNPFFYLLSGGLMLGALFMASDMVGSPTAHKGMWVYGALIGVITFAIRVLGGLPEGIMYAILLGNAAAPHIDQFTQPRIYGERRAKDTGT